MQFARRNESAQLNCEKSSNDEKRLSADGYIVVEMRLTPPLKMWATNRNEKEISSAWVVPISQKSRKTRTKIGCFQDNDTICSERVEQAAVVKAPRHAYGSSQG